MANVKISDLTAYTNPATTDVVPIVDLENDQTKKVTLASIFDVFPSGSTFAAGTAAAPGITFNGDSNTGLYLAGSDELAITTGGTERASVDTSNITLSLRPVLPTHTPASASATGTAGEIAWDKGALHVCTATNTWKTAVFTSTDSNTRIIDELPAADGLDPDSVTNWYTYFQHIGDNGGEWILPSRVYAVSSSTPVVFKVAGTKLSGQDAGIRPDIRITGASATAPTINAETAVIACGFWLANKTRIRGLDVRWSDPDNHKEKALLLFQRAYYSGNDSRADMDSSIDDCVFSARATLTTTGAGIITYLGRNMRVAGCTFSSGSGSGDMRAISLSYAQTASPEVDSDGQTATTGGFRKTIVRDNTFHMTKDAVCVEVFCATGTPTTNNDLYGLLIAGNQNDVGGHLLKTTSNVSLVGAVVSANVNFRSNVSHVLISGNSAVENMVITGNFFGGTDTDSSANVSNNHADGIEVESSAFLRRSTITGNTFLRPTAACINLGHSTKNAIVGNTFSKDDRNNIPALSVVGSGVIVGNTSNCDTFITGTTTNWTQLDAPETVQTFSSQTTHNGGLTVDGPYEQVVETVSALDIDLSTGNYFTKTISANSTFTFSNPPSSGTVGSFTLELTHTSGTVTWPSSVKFPADTAPTLTTGKTHLFVFVTDDGGTRYRGAALADYVN